VIVAGNPGAAAGVLSPLVDPGAAPLSSTGQLLVTPGGAVPWWPRFRIYGPITNPLLVNNTTGEWLRIVVHPRRRRVPRHLSRDRDRPLRHERPRPDELRRVNPSFATSTSTVGR
jgi:hypothetical protein